MSDRNGSQPRRSRSLGGKRALRIAALLATVVLETAALWLRTGRFGGDVAVRCRDGHVFTTIWIPAASVKSLRLGFWRFQHCPVGQHWSIVTPLDDAELSRRERRDASRHHDIRVP